MLSGKLPYANNRRVANSHLREHRIAAITIAIYTGELPIQPTGVTSQLWQLINRNWVKDPKLRLSAAMMLDELRGLRKLGVVGENDEAIC